MTFFITPLPTIPTSLLEQLEFVSYQVMDSDGHGCLNLFHPFSELVSITFAGPLSNLDAFYLTEDKDNQLLCIIYLF